MAFFAVAATQPAHAEWRYDPSMPPAGAASGGGANTVMVVSCGNGGIPAFELTAFNWPNPQEDFVLQIDGNPEDLYFADCQGARCMLDMDTMARAQSFMAQLRSGSTLSVGLYRRGSLDTIPLTGSSAALDQLEAGGCEF
ncbi:hypothetical protein [Gymnodinialimonas hymeniacidonis]|uniref:hypothetical protein n=1 Tax=Gymnodinialimonas hymeniacidonis TaxID=3126508 RepID=UPI0034C63690